MIFDCIKNIGKYKGLYANLDIAIELLNSQNEPKNNHHVRFIKSELATREFNGEMEYHKEHIDIHIVTKGIEKIGYTPFSADFPVISDDTENDCIIVQNDNCNFVNVYENMFTLFFPYEIHCPTLKAFELDNIEKLVVKCRI